MSKSLAATARVESSIATPSASEVDAVVRNAAFSIGAGIFFIGFAEAGFFPGVVLFLTYWFPVTHRGRIMALFMTGLAIPGVVGGPVCGAIMQYLDGNAGLAGWQWLMIATGLPCLLVGVVSTCC